jgi:hypothetical protein
LNVPLALKEGFIDLEDYNAASSAPNAVLGSRNFSSPSSPTIPRIFVSTNNSNSSHPFPRRFWPLSLQLKPLGFIKENETLEMTLTGWTLNGTAVEDYWSLWILFFGPGRAGTWWVRTESFDKEGKGVNVLEVKLKSGNTSDWQLGGPDSDLGIAIDDLRVKFLGEAEGEAEREMVDERKMGRLWTGWWKLSSWRWMMGWED